MDYLSHDNLSDMDIQIDNEVRQSLNESSKWTKFISITMFVLCGIFLLILLLVIATNGGDFFNSFNRLVEMYTGVSGNIILTLVVLFLIVIVYLFYLMFNFSKKIPAALAAENISDLNTGFNSLKLYFIISTIISGLTLIFTLYNIKSIF